MGLVRLCLILFFSVGLIINFANSDEESIAIPITMVTLWSEVHMQGFSFPFTIGDECRNLPRSWTDRAESIDVADQTCAIVFEDNGCRGLRLRLERSSFGTDNLYAVRMARKVSSVKRC